MKTSSSLVVALSLSIAASATSDAHASDVEILLSQENVVSGGITPGDAPGFPATLSASGRYRLVSNLAPSADADGIVIDSDNVTVDFDGFTLDGNGEASYGVASAHNSIEIKDGTVTRFQYFGIDSRASGRFWTISNMRVVSNGLGVTAGSFSRVVGNIISLNNNYGLACEYCLIEGTWWP